MGIEVFGVAVTMESVYHLLIIILSLGWILALGGSVWRHRGKIDFSSIILRTDNNGYSRISKVGILFCFCLILIVIQTILPNMTLDGNLVMLITVCLGTELTRNGLMVANAYFSKGGNVPSFDDNKYSDEIDGKIGASVNNNSNTPDKNLPLDIPLKGEK